MEASRKHGPFDTRWPSGRVGRSTGAASGASLLAADAAEGLDWDGFATNYVRGRRRHNLRALSAYAAYKRGREWGSNGHPQTPRRRLLIVPNDPVPQSTEAASDLGAQRLLAAVAEIETWEGEGGYTPKPTNAKGADMADNTTTDLRQRRSELAESLPELSRKRDHSYRLNSDALALGRAGVRQHTPEELARLGEGQAGTDAAIRDAQREIRNLDAEIQRASGGRFGVRVGRALRRVGGRSQ